VTTTVRLTVDLDRLDAMPEFSGIASCSTLSPLDFDALYYPERLQSVHPVAKRICGGCPIRDECREWAIVASGGVGVWAGELARDLIARPGIRRKLDENKVRDIRRRHAAGESIGAIARSYKVDRKTIQAIVKRATWVHVT
jgi:hypothetical protein